MPPPKEPTEDRYKRVTNQYEVDGTGEVLTMTHQEKVQRRRPRENRERQSFGIIVLDGLDRLADAGLTGYDFRVLIQLLRQMAFEAPFRPYLRRIADDTGIAPTNVSKSMRKLREAGVVIDVEDRQIYLDPTMFWVGSSVERAKAIHKIRALGFNLPTTEGVIQ
jgi:DNA-binding MarR family transcriptional regulator